MKLGCRPRPTDRNKVPLATDNMGGCARGQLVMGCPSPGGSIKALRLREGLGQLDHSTPQWDDGISAHFPSSFLSVDLCIAPGLESCQTLV